MTPKADTPIEIELDRIRLDGGTQAPDRLLQEAVDDYAEKLEDGMSFEPALVYFDGADYWLVDGFHRWHAHRKASLGVMLCRVVNGTQQDAQLMATSCNPAHGVRRSPSAKKWAVITCLSHPVGKTWSDPKIAEHCSVSRTYVLKIRKSTQGVTGDTLSRKVGRDGKSQAATQRKPSPPIADLEPGDETEHKSPPAPKSAIAAHFDSKENKPASSAAKSTYFDDSQHHRLFGPLMRFYQSRAEVKRCVNCAEHKRADEILGMLQDNFEAWQKRVPA